MTSFLVFRKEKIMDKLKFIKCIVFFMTFLFVLGALTLLTVLYKKITTNQKNFPSEILLEEPRESRINNILAHGDYIYIVVKDGGISDRIILFNPQSGQKVSTIKLNNF